MSRDKVKEARQRLSKKTAYNKGIKRGEAPLRNSLPSPLMKGRGIKGEGLIELWLCSLPLREGRGVGRAFKPGRYIESYQS